MTSLITEQEFSAKFKSKPEIYFFLTVQCKAYLPRKEHVTMFFLRDLFSGDKKMIKCSEMKYIYVPQYDSLAINKLFSFLQNYNQLEQYLPCQKEIPKLPKQFLVNIAYTVLGDIFANFVSQQIEDRNEYQKDSKNLNIKIDNQILALFQQSTSHSQTLSAKGSSMLKISSKRRRTKAELEEIKLQDQSKASELQAQQTKYYEMKARFKDAEQRANTFQGAHDVMSKLAEQGVINVGDNGEVEFVPSQIE